MLLTGRSWLITCRNPLFIRSSILTFYKAQDTKAKKNRNPLFIRSSVLIVESSERFDLLCITVTIPYSLGLLLSHWILMHMGQYGGQTSQSLIHQVFNSYAPDTCFFQIGSETQSLIH